MSIEYVFLALAIVLELLGTSLLKTTKGFTAFIPTLFCLLCYGFCYFFFSRCLNSINLSVAYATWCGIGIIASTLFSVFLFKESINYMGVIGIILVVIGVVILNLMGTN